MNDEEPQQIESNINEKREQRIMKIRKINLLKTESGMKLEEIARFQETKNALNKEAEDRKNRYKRMEEEYRELRQRAERETKHKTQATKENMENMEEKEKLQEKFSAMLDGKLNQDIYDYVRDYYGEAYAVKENAEVQIETEKVYARSTTVSIIAVCLEEEAATRREYEGPGEESPLLADDKGLPTQYITTFRVSSTTRNYDLIMAACEFWGRKREDYEYSDERGEVFESKHPSEYLTADKIPTLEKFWRQRRNENNQLLIMMRRKKKDEVKEDENKDKAIDVADDDEEGAAQNGTYQSYNTLLPKLKPYININRAQVVEREKTFAKINHAKSFGENHFCIVFILAVILICMILSIVLQKDMLLEFYTIGNLYKITDLTGISNVNSLDSLLTEFLNNLSKFFPDETGGDPAYGSTGVIRLYKPLMIRQYRVLKTDCQVSIPGIDCYYDFYSPETRDTSNFTDGDDIYKFTLYRGEVQMGTTIDGIFGTYDRNAYITSFSPTNETSVTFAEKICKLLINQDGGFTTNTISSCTTYFNTEVKEKGLLTEAEIKTITDGFTSTSSNYIGAGTRALRISLYLYDISENNFISLEPIVEFTPIGTILTYVPRTTIFKPNLKEYTNAPHNLLNIIVVIFATFLLLFVLYTLFTSGNGGINIGYFVTLQGLLNGLIVILCYVTHNNVDKLNGFGISQETLLLDSSITSLTSVNELSDLYETIFILKSLVVGLLLLRIALVSKLNTRIEIIVTALQNAIPHIMMMTICFGPIALSLAFLCTFMLGPDNNKFDSFGKSLAAVLVLLTGNESDILNSYQPVECIMIIIGFFFLYFLILSVFPAIHVENYRQTLMDYGEEYHTKWTWKRQDYTEWLFSWVPNRIKDCKKKLDAELNAKLQLDKLAGNLDPSKMTGLLKKAGDILPVNKKEKKAKEKKSKKKKQKNSESENQV